MSEGRDKSDCIIAVHLWDWLVPSTVESPEELLERFVLERMCNAICICPDHQPGHFELPVDSIEKHDLCLVMIFFTNNVYHWMQSHAWSGGKGDHMVEYIDHWIDAIVEFSRRRPGKVWWSLGHEHYDQSITEYSASDPENGVIAAKTFASKQEAYEFYREWVLTDLHKIHWSAGHIRQAKHDRVYKRGVDADIPPDKYALGHDIGVPNTLEYMKNRELDPNELFMGAGGTVPCSAAYLFSLDPLFKFFWWECSYVGTGLQPGIAFIRGAAKQYGRKWLMDYSPYAPRTITEFTGPEARGLEKLGINYRILAAGPYDAGGSHGMGTKKALLDEMPGWKIWWPQHDEDGNRLGGLPSRMILRDWLWGYMSGVDCIFQEAAAMTHFIKVDGELRLTPYGRAAKQFFSFVRDRCSDRGRTLTPVALLMDFYHGIDPGREPTHFTRFHANGDFTWGSVPFTNGDHMANQFFDLAFPSQGMWPDRELPWNNDQEYSRLLRQGLEEMPYARQTVVSSTWGDIFDVVLDNADPGILEDYGAVVVLGDISLSRDWLETLRTYVENGGTVLINAAQIPSANWPEWIGCTLDARTISATRFCWKGEPPTDDYGFEMVGLEVVDGDVPATAANGSPLVVIKRLGKGEVWLTSQLHLMGTSQAGPRITQLGRRVLEGFLRPFQPVRIVGTPLAHIVNQRDNGARLITLGNFSPEQWIGRVIVTDAPKNDVAVRDLWNERSPMAELHGSDLIVHLVLPPWGLAVLEV